MLPKRQGIGDKARGTEMRIENGGSRIETRRHGHKESGNRKSKI
jgi:hypothetical protein